MATDRPAQDDERQACTTFTKMQGGKGQPEIYNRR